MRTLSAVLVGVVVFVVGTLVLMLAGAFTLRTALGVTHYRQFHLPVVVIGGSVIGGAIAAAFCGRRVGARS